MKGQHVDPEEAVKIHQDLQAKRSVAIHWGTFALAYEVRPLSLPVLLLPVLPLSPTPNFLSTSSFIFTHLSASLSYLSLLPTPLSAPPTYPPSCLPTHPSLCPSYLSTFPPTPPLSYPSTFLPTTLSLSCPAPT